MKSPWNASKISHRRRQVLPAAMLMVTLVLFASCGRNAAPAEPTPDLLIAEPVVVVLPTVAAPAEEPTAPPVEEAATLATLLSETVPLTSTAGIESEGIEGESIDDADARPEAVEVVDMTLEPALGTVAAVLINVRSAPALSANIVRMAAEGEQLPVFGASDDGQWLRICCEAADGEAQWVAAEFVQVEGELPETEQVAVAALSTDATVTEGALVTADLVNLRGGPGTGYAIVGQAGDGERLDIIGKNEAGDWLQICCTEGNDEGSEGTERWISAGLVTVANDLLASLPAVEAPPLPVAAAPAVGGPEASQAFVAAAAPGLPGDGGFGGAGGTNPLTGLPLAGDRPGQRPVIVCINNDYAARPQYGISQADVMYEYVMEGFGITRFSGIFYGETVDQIGPVRSARLINYYLGALFNAGLACSGASDQVRFTLKHESPFPYMDIDLDDPSNTRYSVSIGQDYRTRLRTATDMLRRWLAEWGAEEPLRLRGFTFGDAGGGAPASSISVPYPSGAGSQVSYVYDGGSGRYMRSLGGSPHLDGNTGAQVGVENVIVQVVPHQITDIIEDSLGSKSIRLNLFGSGRAIIFRDGQAYSGTWRSESRGDTPRFYRDDGSEIPLKPGHTWISVVPPDYAVSYQ